MSITNTFLNVLMSNKDLGDQIYSAAFSRFGVMFFEDS
ncbi:MAG: hypothetical protein Ct9H300mP20_15270 [Gammaproteobacteria bacterium]|nr:MAG: hypothetical protein Ct9H300mP20_15270 [Gammaproteobacteria bacterium]